VDEILPCSVHVYSLFSDVTVPRNPVLGDDKSMVARGGNSGNSNDDREGGDTKTRSQLNKIEPDVQRITKDGIDFNNSLAGFKDATEPSNYMAIVKEFKSFEKQANQNETKKQRKFEAIKKKQWKPFDNYSSINNELYEKSKKSTVREQQEDSPALDGNKSNFNKLFEKNAEGQPKSQMPVNMCQVSKPKRQESIRDGPFVIQTRNRFSCLDDRESIEYEELEYGKESKNEKLIEKIKKHKHLEKSE